MTKRFLLRLLEKKKERERQRERKKRLTPKLFGSQVHVRRGKSGSANPEAVGQLRVSYREHQPLEETVLDERDRERSRKIRGEPTREMTRPFVSH